MLKHYEREVVRLKERVTRLGQKVEEQVRTAFHATMVRDQALARSVIDDDDFIDQEEVELEEECLKLLALHQPVAIDLRFIISVLKINNDLERIADIAVNIAQRAIRLSELVQVEVPIELEQEAKRAKLMLRKALLALVEMDAQLARDVLRSYRDLDALTHKALGLLLARIKSAPEQAEENLLVLSIAKRLERVGDLAANIAEDVVYMVEGEIVRHARDRMP
ncbi:MAG: phosphate signaling complex protein PhoU [Bdellovibrionales bacterium]|nr:phosphate signaling complex protein PhoU [Bdellovibrionales bacterium]